MCWCFYYESLWVLWVNCDLTAKPLKIFAWFPCYGLTWPLWWISQHHLLIWFHQIFLVDYYLSVIDMPIFYVSCSNLQLWRLCIQQVSKEPWYKIAINCGQLINIEMCKNHFHSNTINSKTHNRCWPIIPALTLLHPLVTGGIRSTVWAGYWLL